jgi:RHH-type proline utilization regulon transcriptional repressor/proline dehydrogenase/delta 1-pyrroline-5-carboxylate dehydrogenase
LQEEVADRTLAMLKGALAELRIGNTARLAVDIGPVITAEAKANIEKHIEAMRGRGRRVEQQQLSDETQHGTFVPPTIIELDSIADLEREVFGPVLHVIRYRRDDLDTLIDAINATGYGLTFGLHTRLDETIAQVTGRIKAGNLYINRNVIGAIVGVQPFGGRGLSGTGPKAGGPLYLPRLVHEVSPAPRGEAVVDPALTDLAAWLNAKGEKRAAMLALQLDAASPLGREVELPGPVGERNLYTLHPRGTVLLAPVSREGLFHQLAACLATGNDVVAEADAALTAVLDELPASVRARIRSGAGQVSGALAEGDAEQVTALLRRLAERAGGVVSAQAATTEAMGKADAYDLGLLVEEVSVSINTTAAGGNASLMMLG